MECHHLGRIPSLCPRIGFLATLLVGKYLIPETLNLICQQIFPDLFKNSPPRMQELLEEEDHDEVEQGRGGGEDWHHPGEGEEEAGGCFFLGEHVAHLHLL